MGHVSVLQSNGIGIEIGSNDSISNSTPLDISNFTFDRDRRDRQTAREIIKNHMRIAKRKKFLQSEK